MFDWSQVQFPQELKQLMSQNARWMEVVRSPHESIGAEPITWYLNASNAMSNYKQTAKSDGRT